MALSENHALSRISNCNKRGALYGAAVRFIKKSEQPRVVGVIRSPGVPANVTQTAKQLLGFDVFFDGSTAPPPMADPRFMHTEELETALQVIHNCYIAGQNL